MIKPNNVLHGDATQATLVCAMKLMFLMWLVRYLIDPIEQISALPVEISSPVSLLALFSPSLFEACHSYAFLLIVKLVIVACCLAVWVPRLRMPAALVGVLALTLIAAITRGFGHINHAELGPLLVTWVLTLYAMKLPIEAVQYPNREAGDPIASTALVTSLIVFCLAYSLVGVTRLTTGGMELLVGDTIPNRMIQMSYHDSLFSFNFANTVLSNWWALLALKVGTAAVTIFELFAPVCLISRKFRWLFLAVMPGFHIGAIVLFKIDFIENIIVMGILLTGFTGWLASHHWSRLNQNQLALRQNRYNSAP